MSPNSYCSSCKRGRSFSKWSSGKNWKSDERRSRLSSFIFIALDSMRFAIECAWRLTPQSGAPECASPRDLAQPDRQPAAPSCELHGTNESHPHARSVRECRLPKRSGIFAEDRAEDLRARPPRDDM